MATMMMITIIYRQKWQHMRQHYSDGDDGYDNYDGNNDDDYNN